MFKSYLNIAIRTLIRQRSYTLINLIGLSTGIMACLVILLYVKDAVSYERFYPESDQIYRLTSEYKTQSSSDQLAILPARVLKVAYESIPETEHLTLLNGVGEGGDMLVEVNGKKYIEHSFYGADTTYFSVFQHKFIQGNAKEALSEPQNIVLTAATAQKYFGSTDAFGEILKINGEDRMVAGVIEDFKGNSVLDFDILFSTLHQTWINPSGWYPINFHVFGKFSSPELADNFQTKLDAIVENEIGEQNKARGFEMGFNVEPFTEVYFNTSVNSDFSEKLPKNLMYSLVAVSFFILVIACINYVNLSTAKSEKRAKEVGIRKVMGAGRFQLIWQFYGETFVITLFSVVFGIVLTEFALVPYNNILGTNLKLDLIGEPAILFGLLAITLLVSLLSGSYPASFLSSFSPVKVLKSGYSVKGGNHFRRVLVTVQFIVSVFLIVGTITMARQLGYIQNKEMGYKGDQIVYLKLSDRKSRTQYQALKNAYREIPGVQAVSGSSNLISNVKSGYGAIFEGLTDISNVSFVGHNGDEEFLETMGMELLAGESFINKSNIDSTFYYLVNETAAKALGLTAEEIIGKRFGLGGGKMGTISGVVKDFHTNSIHSKIEPWAVFTGPDTYNNYLFARVNMHRIEEIKEEMSGIWEERISTFPFEMLFIDDSIREAYKKDRQLSKLIISFTLLAMMIASLGLFGLASYLAEKRSKEIGIRKVLGANISRIVYMLSKEYLRIILVANLIAWPVGFYFMNQWLRSFAYSIDVNWSVFLLAGLTTVLVAAITVSYQSVKAAISNPVNALRSE